MKVLRDRLYCVGLPYARRPEFHRSQTIGSTYCGNEAGAAISPMQQNDLPHAFTSDTVGCPVLPLTALAGYQSLKNCYLGTSKHQVVDGFG